MKRLLAFLLCLLVVVPALGQTSRSGRQTARRAAPARQAAKPKPSRPAKPSAKKPAAPKRPVAKPKPPAKRAVLKQPAAKPRATARRRISRCTGQRILGVCHQISLVGPGTGAMALKRKWATVDDLSYFTHAEWLRLKNSLMVRLRNTLVYRLDPRGEQHKGFEGEEQYVRPWTKRFLDKLGVAHYGRWNRPFQVNSAFRSRQHHRALLRTNRNGARNLSPHSTGATIDISYVGMSGEEIQWMADYLLPFEVRGEIEVTLEKEQPVFDIMVRKPQPAPKPPAKRK